MRRRAGGTHSTYRAQLLAARSLDLRPPMPPPYKLRRFPPPPIMLGLVSGTAGSPSAPMGRGGGGTASPGGGTPPALGVGAARARLIACMRVATIQMGLLQGCNRVVVVRKVTSHQGVPRTPPCLCSTPHSTGGSHILPNRLFNKHPHLTHVSSTLPMPATAATSSDSATVTLALRTSSSWRAAAPPPPAAAAAAASAAARRSTASRRSRL